MHIFVARIFCPAPSRVTFDSHSPGLIVGKSMASALAAPSAAAQPNIRAGTDSFMRDSGDWETAIVVRSDTNVNQIA